MDVFYATHYETETCFINPYLNRGTSVALVLSMTL